MAIILGRWSDPPASRLSSLQKTYTFRSRTCVRARVKKTTDLPAKESYRLRALAGIGDAGVGGGSTLAALALEEISYSRDSSCRVWTAHARNVRLIVRPMCQGVKLCGVAEYRWSLLAGVVLLPFRTWLRAESSPSDALPLPPALADALSPSPAPVPSPALPATNDISIFHRKH